MSNSERQFAIIKRPSRAIAEKIVSNLRGDLNRVASRLAEIARKPLSTADFIELKKLRIEAARLRAAERIYLTAETVTTKGE